ncbi:hypothetical protein D3C87_2006250 [compost metagenome]
MAATSSGILVISTRLASKAPAPPPTRSATANSPSPRPDTVAAPCGLNMRAKVVSMAIAIPVMPKTLPRRAVVGCDRPFRAWMKQTEATR